jgi:hypothetical protein
MIIYAIVVTIEIRHQDETYFKIYLNSSAHFKSDKITKVIDDNKKIGNSGINKIIPMKLVGTSPIYLIKDNTFINFIEKESLKVI